MGYFSNGTEGELYEATYCRNCAHFGEDIGGCPVMFAHVLHNYAEANNENSILHLLIPRAKNGDNGKCNMFIKAKETSDGD